MHLTSVLRIAFYGGIFAVLGSIATNCQSANPQDEQAAEGQRLAQQYCGTCHLPVDPQALDKQTWHKRVLPAMAPKLGLEVWQTNHYYQPPSATISLSDWNKLVAYYEEQAPAKPHLNKPLKSSPDWAVFELVKPAEKATPGSEATTTLVAIDSTSGQIYSSSETTPALTSWNASLSPSRLAALPSPAVQAVRTTTTGGTSELVLTCIGTMPAVDQPVGEVMALTLNEPTRPPIPLARQLPRPIQSVPGDFNRDGRTDWIVCGFGHNSGGLYYLKQRPDRQFERVTIKNVPGATQVIPGDFNRDGWLDFMALFAHADEGIWLFTNDQQGGFTEENVLRFPPVYGSTSFQMVDFNRDGKLDILYTCGDNSDYSRVLKPFHGIYLFLNKGRNRYEQASFYPLNGCTKAVATDFDLDGDLDIAAIAFFADLKDAAPQTFMYLEQQKPLAFASHAVPINAYGRWLCMDVNDWDHDHDPDIVLGNYAKGFLNEAGLRPTWNSHVPLIVLKNQTRNPSAKTLATLTSHQ